MHVRNCVCAAFTQREAQRRSSTPWLLFLSSGLMAGEEEEGSVGGGSKGGCDQSSGSSTCEQRGEAAARLGDGRSSEVLPLWLPASLARTHALTSFSLSLSIISCSLFLSLSLVQHVHFSLPLARFPSLSLSLPPLACFHVLCTMFREWASGWQTDTQTVSQIQMHVF